MKKEMFRGGLKRTVAPGHKFTYIKRKKVPERSDFKQGQSLVMYSLTWKLKQKGMSEQQLVSLTK